MQHTNPHRIRRLRWQVRTPRADTALAVRTSLREWLPDIEAVLDAALSQHGRGGEVRRLGTLSVNLQLPPAFSQQELMRALGLALGQALHDATDAMAPPVSGRRGLAPSMPGDARGDAGHLAGLLCALQLARAQAPGALRAALDAARHSARDDGWCDLAWMGQRWSVRLSDVAHWLAGLADANGHVGVDQTGSSGMLVDAPQNEPLPGRPGHTVEQVPPRADAAGQPTSSGLQQAQAQLLHYLRTGQYDWVLAGLPADQAQAALRDAAGLWLKWGLVPQACPVNSPLAQRLGALSRWLALLSDDQRRAMQAHHACEQAGALRDAAGAQAAQTLARLWPDLLRVLIDGGPAVRSDSLHAQALWLDWSGSGGAAMGDTALRRWMDEALPWIESWRRQGPCSDVWHALLALDAASPQQTAEALARGGVASVGQADASHPDQAAVPAMGSRSAHHASADDRQAASSAKPFLAGREPPTSAGHIVSQAGLVLLHAYLPRCLDVLGLYPSGQRGPLADHLWPRAAALLHWLATGRDGALECELGLIKTLLGRRDQHGEHEPLSHGLPTLLPHEREEADALLRAVLGHWRALKGTSVAGLRQSFLQRRGWLEARDQASLLRVEPAPYDVLLGSLPWGMSLVRLPWMAQPLHVEWSTP